MGELKRKKKKHKITVLKLIDNIIVLKLEWAILLQPKLQSEKKEKRRVKPSELHSAKPEDKIVNLEEKNITFLVLGS